MMYIFAGWLLIGVQFLGILLFSQILSEWDVFFFLIPPLSLVWVMPIVLLGIWKGHYAIFGSFGG